MKIVHLFANWKWTGPAEPAVNLAAELSRRGHEVLFLPGRSVDEMPNFVADEARARDLRVMEGLTLDKHFRPIANLADRRRLTGWLETFSPDVLHCHTLNDHLIGGRAAVRLRRPPVLVRSLYDGRVPRFGLRTRRTFGRMTGFLLSASEAVRRAVVRRFGVPEDRTARIEGAVDLARFDPDRALPDLRGEYGIEEGDFVLGIVARMQRKRRFDVFFDAIDRAAPRTPHLRVLLVGRGTNMEEVAVRRARSSRLAERIVFTGYRAGDEFVATMGAMSAKVFLWPGSDGSCRAVREAMAMGVPVIAARTGMLSEIVTDGVDGLLVPHDGEALAEAIVDLATDPERRARLSAAARETARERFSLARQAEAVEGVYRRLVVGPAGVG